MLNLTICVRSCFIIQANIDRSVRTTMQAIAECGRAKHVLAIDWWKGQLKRNTCGFTEKMGTR